MYYVNYIGNEIYIYDKEITQVLQHKIGDLLIDFLDLDFSVYEERRKLFIQNIDFSNFDSLVNNEFKVLLSKKYPKTYQNFIYNSSTPEKLYQEGAILLFYSSNLDTDLEIYNHPYLSYDNMFLDYCLKNNKVKEFFTNYTNYFELQKKFRQATDICLTDNAAMLQGLTPLDKFYCYEILNTSPLQVPLKTSLVFLQDYKYDYWSTEKLVAFVKESGGGRMVLGTECNSAHDFLFYEFFKLMENNINLSICKNCGRFFKAKGKYKTIYCDRIAPGDTKTCKEVGAKRLRNEKEASNPILNEYKRAYKRMYARVLNHNMSKNDFRLWTDEASSQRDSFYEKYNSEPSEDLLREFKDFLGNK